MMMMIMMINRDRDNMTKKLGEEHDQRRIEQMEVVVVVFVILSLFIAIAILLRLVCSFSQSL